MYFPHTVSSVRTAFNSTGLRTADTTPLSSEPCLLAPERKATASEYTPMGNAETEEGILFIGADADIEMGDILTDGNSIEWQVTNVPKAYDNPTNFAAGTDHQQVSIRRHPLQ